MTGNADDAPAGSGGVSRPLWAALLLAALAALPGAAAQTQHTLYLHPIDALADVPMNTQAPPPGHTSFLSTSPTANSLSCVPGAPFGQSEEYHTVYGYATPTLVQYGERDGHPRVNPERGMGGDLALAGNMTLHWYLATEPGAPVLPNVVVRATLRVGDAISVGDAAYNEGAVIAFGQSAPALLAGASTSGAAHGEVDGRAVYGFTVPLKVESASLPVDGGFNLRIDTAILRDECPQGGYAMPAAVAIHSSEGHRPRLEFDGAVPFSASPLSASLGRDRVVLRTVATPVWGFYDVRDIDLTIEGPSPAPTVFGFVFDPRVAGTPFGLKAPFQGTWTWSTAADHAAPGHYVANFTVTDYQGRRHVVAQSGFDLGEPGRQSPGPAPALLALALAALAAALRRRA